jgi:hypothetical protein
VTDAVGCAQVCPGVPVGAELLTNTHPAGGFGALKSSESKIVCALTASIEFAANNSKVNFLFMI